MNAREIRTIRIANGIQQRTFCDLIGVPQGTWSNIEVGRGILHGETKAKAIQVLKDLGCDFSILQAMKGDFPKYTKVYADKPNKEVEVEEEMEAIELKAVLPSINPTFDATKPEHYHKGGIDLFEFLEMKWTPQQMEAFYAGNVLKYVLRYNDKNGLEDLKKARVYLDKLIQQQED